MRGPLESTAPPLARWLPLIPGTRPGLSPLRLSAESVEPAEASPAAAEAPAAPDLLTDAEQISEEEIDAGRTAALKKMLEERGEQ